MKSGFLVFALLAMNSVSHADVPPRNGGREIYTRGYGGPEAAKKWKFIKSEIIRGGSSGWTGFSLAYKVERAVDGLTQTVCTKKSNFKVKIPDAYSCQFEKSLNGRPVPTFRTPPRAMG